MELLVEIVDFVARVAGFMVAVVISFGVFATTALLFFTLFNASWLSRTFAARALFFVISGPIAAVFGFFLWRAARFAGGYIGSSEYPFQHVVRLVQSIL